MGQGTVLCPIVHSSAPGLCFHYGIRFEFWQRMGQGTVLCPILALIVNIIIIEKQVSIKSVIHQKHPEVINQKHPEDVPSG